MKKFLTAPLASTLSIAATARGMISETREVAAGSIKDLRVQVEDLWAAAGELAPHAHPQRLIGRVEAAWEALRNRDVIDFPKPGRV